MDFQTPDWCCDLMCSMLLTSDRPLGPTVLEPTPGEGNLVRAVARAMPDAVVTAPDDFWELPTGSRFDYIVMNPPFSPMKVGYQVLARCMTMSDRIIALMPWLVLINSVRRTASLQEFGLRAVHHLPRTTFHGSRVQCCILDMDRRYGPWDTTTLYFEDDPTR